MTKINNSILDRLKPSDASAMQAQKEEVESKKVKFTKVGFLDILEGENWYRIYPPHPEGTGKTMWEPETTSWLKVLVPKYVDGKATEELEEKDKPIFNARYHLIGAKSDPIEIFIKYYKLLWEKTFLDEGLSKKETKEKIDELYKKYFMPYPGNRLTPNTKWQMYAEDITPNRTFKSADESFGVVKITDGLRKEIEKTLINVYTDAPMGDPFTHPVDGLILIIDRTKEGNKTEYSPRLAQVKKDARTVEFLTHPITPEKAEAFLKNKPLSERLNNAYRASDFNMALQGLEVFDAKIAKAEGHSLLWNNSEFADAMKECAHEINALLPDDENDEPAVDSDNEAIYNDLPFDSPDTDTKPPRKSTLTKQDQIELDNRIGKLQNMK